MISLIIFLLVIFCLLSIIVTNNSIYNVISLILIFLLINCFFLILNLDFLALMMIIVYVGAIAILFLFIVMMINIKILERSFWNIKRKIPLSIILLIILLIQLLSIIFNLFKFNSIELNLNKLNFYNFYSNYYFINNFKVLGYLLYNDMFLFVIIASLILLLAMVASIALTFKQKNILRQELYIQITRTNDLRDAFRTYPEPIKIPVDNLQFIRVFFFFNNYHAVKDIIIKSYDIKGGRRPIKLKSFFQTFQFPPIIKKVW